MIGSLRQGPAKREDFAHGHAPDYARAMVVPTVSNAKNRMRRVITAIVDPWPKDEQPIWDHFSSRCAYCGVELDRKGRKAHMDHATADGGNHLGNLILSCATCNGDEKLGEGWQDFLTRKVSDPEIRAARSRRIEEWMALHPAVPWTPSPEVDALVRELEATVDAFGVKCAELRKVVTHERTEASRSRSSGERVLRRPAD